MTFICFSLHSSFEQAFIKPKAETTSRILSPTYRISNMTDLLS